MQSAKITDPPITDIIPIIFMLAVSFFSEVVLLKYRVNRIYMLSFGSTVHSNAELNLIVLDQKVHYS